jgi:hypothetical protein
MKELFLLIDGAVPVADRNVPLTDRAFLVDEKAVSDD